MWGMRSPLTHSPKGQQKDPQQRHEARLAVGGDGHVALGSVTGGPATPFDHGACKIERDDNCKRVVDGVLAVCWEVKLRLGPYCGPICTEGVFVAE